MALSFVLAAAAGGCEGQPPASSAAGSPEARLVAREVQKKSLQPAQDALRAALKPDQAVQVLALSGGGQWGAFGAGFLKGWTGHGRPGAFHVVTGTSTGSLIATYAFLGSEFDEAVGRAYLGIGGDRDVMKKRFLLTALFSDALATTEPLRRLLEANITDRMLTLVAEEGRKGRRLFVGAVDIESGVFHPFDLTAIAASGPNARKDYIDALMASTAIPVAFPPVVIGGRAYVDGGVRRNIFLQLLVDELGRLRQEQLRRGLVAAEPTVHCLVNGTLSVGARAVKRRTLEIGLRTVDILLDESTDGNLLRVFLTAQRAQLGFRMTRVPADVCHVASSQENQFDPVLMKCLYEQGQRSGQTAEAWTKEPPLNDFSS
jgi:hypothetical protein